ncbi:restriction endonuclease subunit S [Bernardetia sp. Wsw4-3y2]|uniref:restriction endonuclease subunit S n=1 Tax=Bernardetia sp. Wsw4-3y2 TaxID=3127471 RepID=UPI0030CEA1C4
MEKYENYKDSGIEWIGEIPEHWEIKKLKYLTLIGNGRDHKNVWDEDGQYPIIGTGGEFGRANTFLFDKPSVILGRKGTIDKPMFIDKPFWAVDTAYFTISKENTDTKYLFYLSNTINFDFYKYGSAVPSMNQEQLKEIYFSAPPTKKEQTAIANYLDKKTSDLDQLISEKKQLIKLYQEEKTGIINQAVTKGINPDVKLKNSGIEWLGDIPEHWEVKQFRHIIDVLTDYTANGSFASLAKNVKYETSGYSRLVRLTDLRVNLKNDGIYVSEHSHNFLSKSELYGGEILLANVGAYAGLVVLMPNLEGKHTLGPNMFLIRVSINTEYISYYLNSSVINSKLRNLALSSAQPKLNKDNIKSLPLVIPKTLEEQTQIVQHIEKESARIDSKIAKAKKYIKLLTEYRTTLISEVVTGKIKVI